MTDSPAGQVEQVEKTAPDTPQIPKARLDEEIGKRRELEKRLADFEAKLRQTETVQPTQEALEKLVNDRVAKANAPIERQLAAARMANSNGFSEDAANLVLDMQAKGLSAAAAAAAAKAEKPELFVRKGEDQYRAAMHGVLPPSAPSAQPKADEWDYSKLSQAVGNNPAVQQKLILEDIKRRRESGGFR